MPENDQKNKPSSFYFTEPTKITQTAAQAFGPKSSVVFNLTNKFTTIGTVKAFAICKGNILIQQHPTTGRVNVI